LSYRGTAQAGTVLAIAVSSLSNPLQKCQRTASRAGNSYISSHLSDREEALLNSPIEEDLDFFWAQAIVAVPASCGILGKVGSIRSSTSRKLTDVVAVPADLVENIWQTEHVSFVMKEGAIYENDSGAPVR